MRSASPRRSRRSLAQNSITLDRHAPVAGSIKHGATWYIDAKHLFERQNLRAELYLVGEPATLRTVFVLHRERTPNAGFVFQVELHHIGDAGHAKALGT